MIASEEHLAGIAGALLKSKRGLTAPERRLLENSIKPNPMDVLAIRAGILAGDDPLGSLFCQLRSPEKRRREGATYTPAPIVRSMVAWAARQDRTPVRIVDVGAGSGRFSIACATQFPDAEIVAVETDPLAALMLRANASVLGFVDRLKLKLLDFRKLKLPKVNGPTLFIGNPPYVRHHDIDPKWKDWFAREALRLGFKASKLAGLHIHFYLKTRTLAQPGDFGTYITAAEWLDVNYGKVLRNLLGDGLGGASLHVINPTAQPFPDAMVTGAIACFKVGERGESLRMRTVDDLESLLDLSEGEDVAWPELEASRRWSVCLRKSTFAHHGIELGELFRVQRGQVTGSNSVWIAGQLARELIPARFLFPSVTRARELFDAGDELSDPSALKLVVDLPKDLDELADDERRKVDEFLAWARTMGAHESYIAKHRNPWWSVGLKRPAPILVTYMARRAPVFVLNSCRARHINVAHGLYPREEMDDATLRLVLRFLNASVTVESGRTYAGGLTKFEPREVERLTLPKLENLRDMTEGL